MLVFCPRLRRPAPQHTAEVLKGRFDRDQCADWKIEYHRRRTSQQAAEAELKVGPKLLYMDAWAYLFFREREESTIS